MPKKPGPNCCLCGLPYERIGNNPKPLAEKGRCCDACNEIVIEARINPGKIDEEIMRVAEALEHRGAGLKSIVMAVAAICASRGPGLWAAHKAVLEQVRLQYAALEPDDE
jgi:hypothetical protein